MKVLIVDDSAPVRECLVTMLSEIPGVEIIGEARDALEATNYILNLKPDVVILDIRLSRGTGIDVLQDIKDVTPAPKVIVLTNYPYPPYRKKCQEAGVEFFFDKSSEFHRVAEVLEQMLQDSSQ